jgi:ADP-ribosylglycohydrolase
MAIALVLRHTTQELDGDALVQVVSRCRAVTETGLASCLEQASRLARDRAEPRDAARVLGNGVLAEEAVPLVLFSFLRWAPDFTEVVTNTILAGGDTDTTAAMSGALCGALVGGEALPAAWLERMEAGPKGCAHVRQLADATFRCLREAFRASLSGPLYSFDQYRSGCSFAKNASYSVSSA